MDFVHVKLLDILFIIIYKSIKTYKDFNKGDFFAQWCGAQNEQQQKKDGSKIK